jgi:hypothetical protein
VLPEIRGKGRGIMDGLSLTNNKGNEVFIPYQSIDRLTIEPNTVWGELDVPWYKKILSTPTDYIKTGKWDILIETVGQRAGRIVFETKEAAEKKLEEIKTFVPVDIVINKLTVKQ